MMSQTNQANRARSDFARLLTPLPLGRKRLRNRLVHGSMSTYYATGGTITDRLIDYHRNRAIGGAAMIITDSLAGLKSQAGGHRPNAWQDAYLGDLSRWAEAVEEHDCRLLGQLMAPGRARHVPGRTENAVGPSALPDDLSWTVPHAMSIGDVEQMVDEFGSTSRRLQQAGFSGVEFSCGHGHLIHQFLSPWSNHREDKYGGDLDGRLTLVRELVESVRSTCGTDMLIGLKVPGDDGVKHSIGPTQAAQIVARLAQRCQVDYFCPVQGAHARSLEMHMPDMTYPLLPFVSLTRQIRQATPGATIMAAGRINDPGQAERILRDDTADLVMLGRTLLADPGWLNKARDGREEDIRTCLSCNTCWGVINERRPIECVTNPRAGTADEVNWRPAIAPKRRRAVVVGAGVAGLEAAAIAAARGHDVTLFGASKEVGGKLRLHAALPGSEALGNLYANQYPDALKAGVQFELGFHAQLADVLDCRPDAVVLAAGSQMAWPSMLPGSLREEGIVPDLRESVASVLALTGRAAGCAVIYDQDHTRGTYAAAELFSQHFERVVLITPRELIARDEPTVTRQRIYQRIYQRRIEIVLLSQLCEDSALEEGRVAYENVYNGDRSEIADVSVLTYATSRMPNNGMASPLHAAGVDVHLIGDCYAPRGMLAATREGHSLGNAL